VVHADICEDAAGEEAKKINGLLLKLIMMSSFDFNFNSSLLIASLTLNEKTRMMQNQNECSQDPMMQ